MALTDTGIKNLRPAEKPYKRTDSSGLYLYVTPTGGKLWRLKFRFNGKEKTLALGKYPQTSLSGARDKAFRAKQQLDNGVDPAVVKQAEKRKKQNYFGDIALEWWRNQRDKWTPGHADYIWRRIEANALPWLKNRPIGQITTGELLKALRRIESRNAYETAKRVCQYFSNIFLYAVSAGYTESNPASDLTKALKFVPRKNLPAVTEPKAITELLQAIDAFAGTYVVKCALQLAPLVFVRAGELRAAGWQEIDFENALWTIPETRMKMKRPHIVPLSRQALEILQELQPLTGGGRYVFPSVRTSARPMSENTLNAALRRLGYDKDTMCAHGFRTMASTRLHELGWKSEIIEFQLAHADKNKVRGVYNRAEYLDQRITMMQAWSDYLDSLKAGADVIPMKRNSKTE